MTGAAHFLVPSSDPLDEIPVSDLGEVVRHGTPLPRRAGTERLEERRGSHR